MDQDIGNLFDIRGFGLIKGEPKNIYESAKTMGKRIAIVKNNHETSEYGKLLEMYSKTKTDFYNNFKKTETYRTHDVLEFYLKIHEEIPNNKNGLLKDKLASMANRDYRFADVVFLEVGPYLKHEMEYTILMYTYLLNIGLCMSEFYVIVDYDTKNFDFIETDVFRKDWPIEKILPIPNSLEKIVDKNEVMKSRFETSIYVSNFNESKIQYIVSDSDLYINTIRPMIIDEEHTYYENYTEYKKAIEMGKSKNYVSIIRFKSPEEVMVIKDIDANLIIMDNRVKIETNLQYSGNLPIPKKISNDYIIDRANKLITMSGKKIKFVIYSPTDMERDNSIQRGIFERSPIFDYLLFENHNVNMLALYTNYMSLTSINNFTNAIRAEIELLKEIGYMENPVNFRVCTKVHIHPVIAAIINRWFNEKNKRGDSFPKFPILFFAAVVTMFDKKTIELRDHGERERGTDISESCKYGQEMKAFMNLMITHGKCVFPEGGRTSDRLKKLVDFYGIQSSDIGVFDINEFTSFLVYILNTYFDSLLLTKKEHSNYRGKTNQQLNWWISQASGAAKIFPITVFTSYRHKNVALHIPIENC